MGCGSSATRETHAEPKKGESEPAKPADASSKPAAETVKAETTAPPADDGARAKTQSSPPADKPAAAETSPPAAEAKTTPPQTNPPAEKPAPEKSEPAAEAAAPAEAPAAAKAEPPAEASAPAQSEAPAETAPPAQTDPPAEAAATSTIDEPKPEATSSKMSIPFEVLAKQDSSTSAAVIEACKDDELFKKLSEKLTKEIMQRDTEDGEKLAKGIQLAVDKGVLPADVQVEPTTKVDVTGKTADAVADEIIAALGDAPSKGCVMTLQGLSGTGKGTTVAKLKEKLPKSVTWSNGNAFRSLTLLAVTYTEKNECSLEDALKPEKLAEFCKMLDFDEYNGKFDVKIEGLEMKHYVSEIQNTVLKESRIATNIPTVAEVTQGEVINFVQGALEKMAAAGSNVLVEGREQTLNHIRTPHRFELMLQDTSVIGMRQAALQVGAKAYAKLKEADSPDCAAIEAAVTEALASLAG